MVFLEISWDKLFYAEREVATLHKGPILLQYEIKQLPALGKQVSQRIRLHPARMIWRLFFYSALKLGSFLGRGCYFLPVFSQVGFLRFPSDDMFGEQCLFGTSCASVKGTLAPFLRAIH